MPPVSPRFARRFRALTFVSVATAAITAFAGVANAAPAQPVEVGPVHYSVTQTGSGVNLSVSNGSISHNGQTLSIRNAAGAEVYRMPLNYRLEDRQFPIAARGASNSVSLTPVRDVSQSTTVDRGEVERLRGIARTQVAAPQTRQERDDQALGRLQQQLSLGITVSTLIGTGLGALVGAVAGCVLGVALGCLPTIPIGATIGGIVGTSLGGGGTLIAAAIQYFNTINSPFKPPRR
ncbi:hypothetical protein [Gordonia soli]|uniref:DUF8020 domain-containing protein n=1 Tax=Gordonia soli NBRC 108243 TaxID=1223545 RepID=M0QHV0_9ACTN|nr:hypothetical protein [Gordonia soli]GAC68133.1 hypothetical protein GS4_11_04050 [Gordonia soli NBRC 108243]